LEIPVKLLPTILFLGGTQACERTNVSTFWQPGQNYSLQMVVRDRPAVPLRQPVQLAVARDSMTVGLRADSVVRDTVFGSLVGDSRGFAPMFRAVGTDHFIGTRKREEWKIIFNPKAPALGIGLIGQLSRGNIRGAWSSLVTDDQGGGNFTLTPAS
jgi:hypothetical protein